MEDKKNIAINVSHRQTSFPLSVKLLNSMQLLLFF